MVFFFDKNKIAEKIGCFVAWEAIFGAVATITLGRIGYAPRYVVCLLEFPVAIKYDEITRTLPIS